MPPRSALSSRATRLLHVEPYICPTCLFSNPPRSRQQPRTSISRKAIENRTHATTPGLLRIARHHHRRQASTVVSSTAINAPSHTPGPLRDLHRKLSLLQDRASSYVDLSRVQLALRSLESGDPVIRVAFLGVGGATGVRAARLLARVLLADALSDGEEAWERELVDGDDGRSVLVKYGDRASDTGVQGGGAGGLVREMRIPSLYLKRWNVEILVTGLNLGGVEGRVEDVRESILVPPLTIPGAGSRPGFVRYPVHKAVVVAEGVSGAVELGRLPRGLVDGKLIRAAISLSLKDGAAGDENGDVVDVGLAAHALRLFREDNANGAVFSSEWQASRVTSMSEWMAESSKSSNILKPGVEDLLQSMVSRSSNAIAVAEDSAQASSTALTVADSKRAALLSALASWSEDAHHDLQTNLATAFASPAWRRTTWWRLFWRIDEVSISAHDVLRRGWLVEAEQRLAFLSGRIREAGLASEEHLKGISTVTNTDGQPVAAQTLLDAQVREEIQEYTDVEKGRVEQERVGTVAELMQLPPLLHRIREETGVNAFFDPPWPQSIHLARQQILHQMVPDLHAKAQRLMIASLSTIGGSGALGAWLWLASGGVALSEGGAVAALGFVWALRRLQNQWSQERADFADTTREDARRVLKDVEGRLAGLVNEGGRVGVREEDRREWHDARAAVDDVSEALASVRGKRGE